MKYYRNNFPGHVGEYLCFVYKNTRFKVLGYYVVSDAEIVSIYLQNKSFEYTIINIQNIRLCQRTATPSNLEISTTIILNDTTPRKFSK